MKKILIASSNETIIKTVNDSCADIKNYFTTETLRDTEQIIRYINYDLPDINVMDFTSPDIDCARILDTINEDPWLHYGGVIAVCENMAEVKKIEDRKDGNILSALTLQNFVSNFKRLLHILENNQHFLFNRGMQDTLGGKESGTFICDNNPIDINFYATFLISYLYNTNRITNKERIDLQMTFSELLTNALEHGNLEISYNEKQEFLEAGGNMLDLIARRASMEKYKDRKIIIAYSIGKNRSVFCIKDKGNGFDWKKYTKMNTAETEVNTNVCGRGIKLSSNLVNRIKYNNKGNQVAFEITNQINRTNTVPGIMKPFSSITYTDKQIICRQNEMTNDLFFIVSGRYGVYSNEKLVAVLNPADMFIGEMSFLLNDRRSATVVAIGNCRLIKIPKQDFLNMIRTNPHYGIFLAKMLAQRLQRQTQSTIRLSRELQHINTSL